MNIRSNLFPTVNTVKIAILHNQQRLSSGGSGFKLILTERRNNVTRLTMNNPHKLNGWTVSMLDTLFSTLRTLAADTETRVVILTGSGEGQFNVREAEFTHLNTSFSFILPLSFPQTLTTVLGPV